MWTPLPVYGKAEGPEREWTPFSWALPAGDFAEFAKLTWPELYVHRDAVKNQPTKADPLGAQASLEIQFLSDDATFRVRLFNDWTPYMAPQAIETYLYVQWPETFRRGSNGQPPD